MSRSACLSRVVFVVGLLWSLTGAPVPAAAEEAPPAPAAPADEPVEVIELGEVRVLASPVVEPTVTTRYGTQVSSVTAEQIEALGAEDFASAVRRVPGVTISRFNRVGSFGGREGGAVFIRGMGGARPGAEIQTLVDGVPKTVGVWTHPLLDTLPVDLAERIDIRKSAEPVFLGNASFAAFDLIPRRRTLPGFETRLRAGYGTHSTWTQSFEHGGKVDRWDYFLAQSFKRSRGHRPHSAGQMQSYMARLGYELSDVWDASLMVMGTDSWAEDPGPVGEPTPERERFNVDDFLYVFTLANRTEEGEGEVKLYWHDGSINWREEDGDSDTEWDNYGMRASQTIWPWEGGELVVGADLDYIGGEFINRDLSGARLDDTKKTFRLFGPHLAFSQTFGDPDDWHVTPSAGTRWTHHNEFRNLWGPQAGVVVGRGETELHASYARGFNYPGVYAVVQSEMFWNTGDAWRELKPETVDHFQLGLGHRFAPWLKGNIVGFINDGQDRLVFVAPPPPPPAFQNIGEFKTEGVEVSFDITPAADWNAFLGATWLTTIEPRELPYAPRRSFTGGVSWMPHPRWRVNVDGQYVSDVFTLNPRFPGPEGEVDSYWLFNGKVSYDVLPADGNVQATVYAAVENIFDETYEHRPAYPMPGRSLMAGFDVRF